MAQNPHSIEPSEQASDTIHMLTVLEQATEINETALDAIVILQSWGSHFH